MLESSKFAPIVGNFVWACPRCDEGPTRLPANNSRDKSLYIRRESASSRLLFDLELSFLKQSVKNDTIIDAALFYLLNSVSSRSGQNTRIATPSMQRANTSK